MSLTANMSTKLLLVTYLHAICFCHYIQQHKHLALFQKKLWSDSLLYMCGLQVFASVCCADDQKSPGRRRLLCTLSLY